MTGRTGPTLEPLDGVNLRGEIAQRIRQTILGGTYMPGEKVNEAGIAEQLGVSRAPVREALGLLEREGLIVSVPRRGRFVIDIDDKIVEEIYSLRLLLEIGALRRAITRITDQDIREMTQLLDRLNDSVHRESDPETIVSLDLAFHERLCRAADHSRLFLVWNSLRLQTQLLISLTSRTHYDHPDQPMEYHLRVLDAIQAGDLQSAEARLTEHILDGQQRANVALQELRRVAVRS